MKKNLPYIIVVAVIAIIVVVSKPWERPNPPRIDEPSDTIATQVNGETEEVDVDICIYMENSGSMDGYVNLNSDFKDALGKIIVKSDVYGKSTNLYFINDKIYDIQETALKGDVNNFVSQLNASTMKIGMTGSSNINQIFRMVLDKTAQDTVSILFSDFVYSIKGTDVSSQVANAKNATMGAFMNAIKSNPNFATIILQCSSQFKGKYYDRNDKPIAYTGTRPYYIFIMGSCDKLQYIDKKLELNTSSTGIPGLMNIYFLSSKSYELNDGSVQVLTNSYTNSLLIKPEKNEYDIDFFKFDKNDAVWEFGYALDVSNMFIDESYLTDIANYEIEPSEITLMKAEFTKEQAAIDEVTQFTSPLVLQLGMNNTTRTPNIKVRLINHIPSWVSAANIMDDQGVVPEPMQTFAIESLISGVFEAFKSQTSNNPIFEYEVTINKYK